MEAREMEDASRMTRFSELTCRKNRMKFSVAIESRVFSSVRGHAFESVITAHARVSNNMAERRHITSTARHLISSIVRSILVTP